MIRITIQTLITMVSLCFACCSLGFITDAEAASTVSVVNETGYYLTEVKYVQIIGEAKKLIGQTKLHKGKSYTFQLQGSGKYIVYISFLNGNDKVYAKGNIYNIENETRAVLTIHKVILNNKGNSVKFINKGEFDNIK